MVSHSKSCNAIYLIICFAFIGKQSITYGQNNNTQNSFDKELNRLNTNTAQVFGRDISQIPSWSTNSDTIYCANKSGKIYFISLNDASLTVGVWHNDTIGVIRTSLILPLSEKETMNYTSKHKGNESFSDSVKTKSGTIVKFAQMGLGTALITQEKNKIEKVEWTSFSVCGGIVLSPDEKYVIFYCETSGVFIMKL